MGRIVIVPDPANCDRVQLREILQKVSEDLGRLMTEEDVMLQMERRFAGLDKKPDLWALIRKAKKEGRWPPPSQS